MVRGFVLGGRAASGDLERQVDIQRLCLDTAGRVRRFDT